MCIEEQLPFEIPDSWQWIRLATVGDWGSGATPSRTHPEYYGGDIPWLKTGDLNDGYIVHIPESITAEALEKTSVRLNPKDSVLVAMYGATIGKLGILTYPATTNQACCACLPIEGVYNKFLFYFLMSHKTAFIKRGEGGAQPNISKEKIIATLMPLPPLAEQQRIVAKIEQILPHIKEYELSESRIGQLNAAFPEQLKKSILQEAVQGKLVPQDPSDEPASVLLERIREEKARLVKEGKIKKDKNESVIFRRDNSYYEKSNGIERCIDDEIPFEIPNSWEWVRLKKLGISQTGNTPSKNHPEYFGGFVPFIGPGDIVEYGINTNNKGLSRIGLEFGRLAKAGSILQVCIGGSIGKAAINHVDMAFNQQINCITPIELNKEFLFCAMISPYFVKTIKERAGGTATPIINRGEWDNILVPVAPIREQSRIVKTIESILKCFNISLGITNQ